MGSKHWQEPFTTVRIPAPAACRLMGMVVTLGPQGSAELWQSPCGCLLPRVFTTTRTIFMTMQSKSFSSLSALSCQKFKKKKISFLLLFWGCSNSDLELSCFVTLLPPHSVNTPNIVHIPLIIFHQYLEEVFSKN